MNKRALKTAIIISWIVLAVCFVIKLFGGKYFEIAINNDTFNAACEFVDNHLWLQDIIGFVTSFSVVALINLAVLKQRRFKRKQFVIVFAIFVVCFIPKILGDYIEIFATVGFIADLLQIFLCPLILSKKFFRALLSALLYVAFQVISVVIKGLSLTQVNDESLLIALIYSIDMYIMLVLYYLYSLMSNKREDNIENKIQKQEA